MNDDEKNLKINENSKNCKIPVPTKESIRNSVHPCHNPHPSNVIKSSKFYNKACEQKSHDVSKAKPNRISYIPAEKGPQIHESGRKINAKKLSAEQINNADSKIVRAAGSRIRHERKYCKLLVSDEKSSNSASRKEQSALKTNRATIINDSNCNKTKKTLCKTHGKCSLPKPKEVPCKTILSLAESGNHRGYKAKDCYSKRKESSRSASKESETVNRKQENYYAKKYSEKVGVRDKIKLNSKKTDTQTNGLEKTKQLDPQKIVEVQKTEPHIKTVCEDNANDANKESNGAARTRIFKRKKSSQVDKNLTDCEDAIPKREAEYSRKEDSTGNPIPSEKQNKNQQENKTRGLAKHNCEQVSDNSLCNIKNENIISLYDGSFTTPESSTNCNQYQESEETCAEEVGEKTNDNFSFTTSSETNRKQSLSKDIRINLCQENVSTSNEPTEVCCNKNIIGKDKEELITDSAIKTSDHDYREIKKSLTVTRIPSGSQDEITYHTNLMNYGYHCDQQYCERSNKQPEMKHDDDNTAIKLKKLNESQILDNDDAKYNLIRALIQPATGIHNFKTKDNKVQKLLLSGRRSEHVITGRDEDLQNCYVNSFSDDRINEGIINTSNIAKQSQDNIDNFIESSESRNSHASAIDLKHPLSNTSDYIAMNLKMKGCKNMKKYRHFKHEEKNMCCNMARFIQKIVTNENKYQEFEKKENLEREEVKIIIDENSPKTSKIRIVNDRSSVSVVCHSLGRTSSSGERRNNTMANKVESSGGESSGYKSFHNNFNTKNLDASEQIDCNSKSQQEIENSAITTSHNPKSVHDHDSSTHYETSTETFYDKANVRSSVNTCDSLCIENMMNRYGDRIEEGPNSKRNAYDEGDEKQNAEIKYSSYDTKNYLSTFTNCIDVHLPCEITAYQFQEKNRSRILRSNNQELVEKDIDNAELHVGEYLTDRNSDIKNSESSEEEESSEHLGSVKDFQTAEDEVIMIKKPDNLKYESLEFVVNERLLEPDNVGERSNSTIIPAAPAQYRIVTSKLDLKSEGTTESLEKPMSASHVKFTIKNDGSTAGVKFSNDYVQRNYSNASSSPVPQVTTKDTHKSSGSYGTSCSGGWRNRNERSDETNAVHELWANKKSTVDSTDNDSQSSGRSRCGKSDSKKCDTNKLRFNIFRKSKSSASERAICIPLDQLPKPPASFLEFAAPSQSTIFSSTDNTNQASESDITRKPHEFTAPILRTHSFTKSRADTAPIHYARNTRTDSVSSENMNHSPFQTNSSHSTVQRDTETASESYVQKLSVKPQAQHSAVPPPASALPPPYPFCCPLVPYMMQYWQNNQQPPPASTVPLPEGNWKPNDSMVGTEPPPPGMVPIPWFPPMIQMNNPPPSGANDARMSSNLHTQPPPEWLTMPRGYAPCLPCSKTLESRLGRTDSLTFEDDKRDALESSGNKQDGKKKGVSNKLFNIFRRKTRADMDTLDEDEKKFRGRYQRMKSDAKPATMHVVQNDEGNFDDRSIWESPDIAGIVTPEEIGRCFRRGFRADGLTLSGDDYVCTKAPSDTTSEQEDIFNFSDHDTPLDFLLALGFSVDEATAAIRDDEVRSRFKAALTEARIWVPHIATTQGTLLYLLAMKAKPKVMRYFLQLVESIVNKRITNAVKLDAYLKILEKVEDGYVSFVTLFGKDKGTDDEEDTVIVEKQRRRIFYTIYKYAESEAKEVDRPLTRASVDLLHSLAARYRPAIGPHLRLLACYIGEGLLTKDVQLEAAVIYLSRLDSAYVKLTDLEKYCGLPPSERRRVEQIGNIQS